MELKEYQAQTLAALRRFFEEARVAGPKNAYENIIREPEQAERLGRYAGAYTPLARLPEVPYVCLRLPTGGGKTILVAHAGRTGRLLGVRLAIDDDPMRLAEDVGRFALIVIEVPSSADGRFFSIAARLREHLRYRHELRVTGDVAPDQLSFMRRCGIDAFEVGDHVDAERFIRRYRRFYQSSGPLTTRDNLIPLARRRVRSGNTAPFEDRRRRRREAVAERPV